MGQACSCFMVSAGRVDTSSSFDTTQSATPTDQPKVNGVLVSSESAEKAMFEMMSGSGSGFHKQGSLPMTRFTIKELTKATKNFKSILGEGAFGKVFEGRIGVPHLGENLPCAIKRLNPDSLQGQDEWMAEILILGSVKHPNLIKLYGYSSDRSLGYLVYELAPLGSLDRHLYPKDSMNVVKLTWRHRIKIAYQIAQALNHLHSKRIIHRDLKPSNVLLDENMNVKLTDFGLAKVASSSQSNLTTRILGTMGYLDPHYVETGQVSILSDVYAYGVMLLELLTGRKSITSESRKPLPILAQEFFSKKKPNVLEFIDPEVVEEVRLLNDMKVALYLGTIARHCTSFNVAQRPTMADLVSIFRDLVQEHKARVFKVFGADCDRSIAY